MNETLNETEVRVLGALIEKELATPEYYPLTLNSLAAACNQKSNRDPVTSLDEPEIVRALDSLKLKQLVLVSAEGGRARKYRHILAERLRLGPAELSILAELLLRGPQTVGELRTRAERMHPFADLAEVEKVLQELAELAPPLVTRLPRQPGRKESRYAQLFAGEPAVGEEERTAPPEAARVRVMAEDERVTKLEREIAALREEVTELRRVVDEFRAQFE
jgi:uncharacterized protein